MREKLIRFSKAEHKRLLELHKLFYSNSWMYVPLAETINQLAQMAERKVKK